MRFDEFHRLGVKVGLRGSEETVQQNCAGALESSTRCSKKERELFILFQVGNCDALLARTCQNA